MSAAYVDTSALVAVLLGEPQAETMVARLSEHETLLSSNLLEAELRAVLSRESVDVELASLVRGIDWVLPDRPLAKEIKRVLEAGYVRGADAWHLACALYLDPGPSELHLISLDQRQLDVGRSLGFEVQAHP